MNPPILFDHTLVRTHKRRYQQQQFFTTLATERLCERLQDMDRRFTRTLSIGTDIHTLTQQLPDTPWAESDNIWAFKDNEQLLKRDSTYDLILVVGTLHWINDLPGMLIQLHQSLSPEGLFMAVIPGGASLSELREVLADTEMALYSGISPRISPFIDVRDAAALLQRAGFSMPVADSEQIQLHYRDIYALCHELRTHGETNALIDRNPRPLTRYFWEQANKRYCARYPAEDSYISATAELVTLTGIYSPPSL